MKNLNPIAPLRNQSGMGILQMLVLVAVSAALIAAIASSMVNMVKSQQSVAQAIEADLAADQIAQVLSDDAICTANVANYPADIMGSEQALAFNLPMAGGVSLYMNTGTVLPGNRIAIMKVTNQIDTTVAPVTLISGGVPLKRYESILRIQMKKLNSSLLVQEMKPYQIRLHMMLNAGNQAVGCAAESAGSMACVAQGGVWNPIAPDGEKCVALKYCQFGGSYADAADGDGGFANSITGLRSCPTGFVAQQSGTISKTQSQSKYTVSASYSRIYNCMKCGSQLAAQTAAVPPNTPLALDSMVNQEVYEAVAYTDNNNYEIAAADTQIAYTNWQNGVAQSNQLQSLINQSTSNQASASNNISSSQATLSAANSNLSQANSDLSAAQSAYNVDPSPANSSALSSAQATRDSRQVDVNTAQANLAYWQDQQNISTAAIGTYSNQKQSVDANNTSLYALYLQKKAVSDNLQQIAQASSAAAAAHQEPPN